MSTTRRSGCTASTSPTCACPAMTDVREAFAAENLETLHVDPSCRWSRSSFRRLGSFRAKSATRSRRCSAIAKTPRSSRTSSGWRSRSLTRSRKFASWRKPKAEDLLVVVAGAKRTEAASAVKARQQAYAMYAAAGTVAAGLGQKYAERHGAFKHGNFRLLWVTDFPMFEWDEDRAALERGAPSLYLAARERHGQAGERSRRGARAGVRRGAEWHRAGLGLDSYSSPGHSGKIFKALGMSPEEQQARFGFFLEALQYGTPPHGGIALGLDRIVMILAGAKACAR